MRGRPFRLLIGLTASGAMIVLILRGLNVADVTAALRDARPGWIAVAVLLFGLGYACRIERWRLMLVDEAPGLGWWRCAVPLLASTAANNVLPSRAGDIMRGFAFSGWLGIGSARIVGSLVVERLLDLLAVLAALAVALMVLGTQAGAMGGVLGVGGWGLGLIALLAGLVLLVPQAFEGPVRAAARAVTRIRPGLGNRLADESGKFFSMLRRLSRGRRTIQLMAWSLAAWTLEGTVFYSVARGLPSVTEPALAWVAMPVGTLSTMLPSTPGYVGTFHYFVMEATEVVGNPAAVAAAYAVLVHLVLWATATALGALSFLVWTLSRHTLSVPEREPSA